LFGSGGLIHSFLSPFFQRKVQAAQTGPAAFERLIAGKGNSPSVIVTLVSAIATFVPAQRASAIAPSEALRRQ
jgi:ABC-type antimicrobial peptide transport system permease subunit